MSGALTPTWLRAPGLFPGLFGACLSRSPSAPFGCPLRSPAGGRQVPPPPPVPPGALCLCDFELQLLIRISTYLQIPYCNIDAFHCRLRLPAGSTSSAPSRAFLPRQRAVVGGTMGVMLTLLLFYSQVSVRAKGQEVRTVRAQGRRLEDKVGCHPQEYCPSPWRRCLSLAFSSLIRLGWLASEPRCPPVPTFPILLSHAHPTKPSLLTQALGLTLQSSCTASTSPHHLLSAQT